MMFIVESSNTDTVNEPKEIGFTVCRDFFTHQEKQFMLIQWPDPDRKELLFHGK